MANNPWRRNAPLRVERPTADINTNPMAILGSHLVSEAASRQKAALEAASAQYKEAKTDERADLKFKRDVSMEAFKQQGKKKDLSFQDKEMYKSLLKQWEAVQETGCIGEDGEVDEMCQNKLDMLEDQLSEINPRFTPSMFKQLTQTEEEDEPELSPDNPYSQGSFIESLIFGEPDPVATQDVRKRIEENKRKFNL